jgi:hypothetical protein
MRKTAITIIMYAATAWVPANAATGNELLGYNPEYARGFVWGIVTALTSIAGPADMATVTYRRDCFINSKITDQTFYVTLMTWIQNHPAALAQDAPGAVIAVVNEICGVLPSAK